MNKRKDGVIGGHVIGGHVIGGHVDGIGRYFRARTRDANEVSCAELNVCSLESWVLFAIDAMWDGSRLKNNYDM